MSFRATVIAVKVVLLAGALLAVLTFAYAEKTSNGMARPAQTFLGAQGGDS